MKTFENVRTHKHDPSCSSELLSPVCAGSSCLAVVTAHPQDSPRISCADKQLGFRQTVRSQGTVHRRET